MREIIHGVIHGKTIELADDPRVADGEVVEVRIRRRPGREAQIEAILRVAGSMADDPEFDAAMAEVERFRRTASFRDLAE